MDGILTLNRSEGKICSVYNMKDKGPITSKEMSIIDKILQLGDTNYASVNADVAFRMAAHYTNSYQNIQKGLEYLNIAHDWAERAQDTCLLRKIQESKETFR